MFAGLDEVAWESLSHAYGKAADVPGHLQDLIAPDQETRQGALRKLRGSICHQGTRYSASPVAIPFLFEIVADTQTNNRAAILDLILSLGLGDPDALLPEGVDPKSDFGDGKSTWSRLARKCYRTFAEQWTLLQTLAQDDDLRVRLLGVYALAWIPKHAQSSLLLINDLLVEQFRSLVRADMLLTMGLLNRHSAQTIGQLSMERDLASDDVVLRLAAAIALVTMPIADKRRAFEVILSSLKLPEELFVPSPPSQTEQPLPFGDLVEYASTTLRWMPAGNEARIVRAVVDALPAASGIRGLVMTREILKLGFGDPAKTARVWAELSPLQREILQGVAISGGWKIGDRFFGNFGWLIHSYGLPGDFARYQEYIRDASGHS